ncbi:MAG: SRPBCC family protein [Knoellia sp.]
MEHRDGVATISREVAAPREAVWDVLADGWLYPTWVVGASRVRSVDQEWPAVGACIRHSVGLWPALINDRTEVLHMSALVELTLKARAWPAGDAHVVITISPRGENACTVHIEEDAASGPGALIPQPLRQLGIGQRNTETLTRLAFLAEGRYRDRSAR